MLAVYLYKQAFSYHEFGARLRDRLDDGAALARDRALLPAPIAYRRMFAASVVAAPERPIDPRRPLRGDAADRRSGRSAPIVLVVTASFKPARQIFDLPPRLLFEPTLENYRALWREWPDFFRCLSNSLIVTVGATLLTRARRRCLAGYVYSRYRGRGARGVGVLHAVRSACSRRS